MSNQGYTRHYSEQHEKDLRNRQMRKIHAEFPKLRPDLRHSSEELKLERLAFCERVLGLRKPLETMTRLSNEQLGKVIEAIKREMPQQQLPGCSVHHFRNQANAAPVNLPASHLAEDAQSSSAIHHLAGPEQVWAIKRVLQHLGWSREGTENFIQTRYHRTGPEILTPKQANALLVILFNIAAARELKARVGAGRPVTRAMIAAYVPELKRKLGIAGADQRGQAKS